MSGDVRTHAAVKSGACAIFIFPAERSGTA
jgi:hypothetical protein